MSGEHTIPVHVADRAASLINAAEDMRKQAADELKQIYADLREELRGMGWAGSAISAEVAALKGAIAEMRIEDSAREKREAKDARVDTYVLMLNLARARAHARGTKQQHSSVAPTPATDGQAGVVQSPLSAPAANSNPQPTSSPEADGAGDVPPPASPAVPDFVPAFLAADARPKPKLCPNCLRPETCAGHGVKHCHSCEKAAAAQSVAA